jgi:hypothetical protein
MCFPLGLRRFRECQAQNLPFHHPGLQPTPAAFDILHHRILLSRETVHRQMAQRNPHLLVQTRRPDFHCLRAKWLFSTAPERINAMIRIK